MSNIVTALYNDTGRARTRPLYRYDYGQVLQINGATLPETYEVHFSNSVNEESVTVTGDANGVAIPDVCLIDGRPVYAWLFMHTGENDGETVFHITIPVIDRASLSGEAPTPVKHDLFQEAMDAVAEATEEITTATEAMNAHFPATGKFVAGTGSAAADYAVAEGHNTQANAPAAHAEGYMTKATGDRAHSEGVSTTASGWASHAEGSVATASGDSSHAENSHTIASGNASHAEGANTQASGHYSHAEGYYTRATHKAQHVFGEFNVLDGSSSTASNRGNYVEIVGNGTGASARSNARTLDWNGNEELSGSLKVGNGVTVNNVTLANNTLNQPMLLTLNQCNELQLIYEEDLGDVVHVDEVYLSMQQIKNLLSMLNYYQGITPFTASEISALRTLIGGGEEEPVPEEPVSEEQVTANDGTVFSTWRCGLITSENTSDYPNATAVYEVVHHAGESSFTIKLTPGYNYESINYFIDSATVGTQYNESTGVTVNENGTTSIIKFYVHKPAVNQQSEGAVVEYVILVSVGGEEEPVTEEPVTEEPVTEEPVAEDP